MQLHRSDSNERTLPLISSPPHYTPETFRPGYASAHSRARIVTVLLTASAVLSLGSILLSALQFVFPKLAFAEEEINEPELLVFGLLLLGVGLIQIAVYIATIVVFLMWLYRSYENLPSFGVHRNSIQYSSGWAVGSFFIPFVNLIIPYRAVKELWSKSVPNRLEMFSEPEPPGFFPLWWAAWLLSNFANNVYMRLAWNEQLNPEVDATLGMLTGMLDIVSAVLAIMVVRAIDKQQEVSASLVTRGSMSPSIPPPPNFGPA